MIFEKTLLRRQLSAMQVASFKKMAPRRHSEIVGVKTYTDVDSAELWDGSIHGFLNTLLLSHIHNLN